MTHKLPIVLFLASTGLASPTPPAAAQDTVLLKPRHTVGRLGYYELEQNARQELIGTQVPGGSSRGKLRRVNGFIEKIEQVEPGLTTLTLTYDRVCQVHDNTPTLDLFDTDNPRLEHTSEELGAALTQLLGMPLNFTLDADGRVKSIIGMMEIRNKLAKNLRGNRFLGNLGKELTDEKAKMAYGEHRFALYPNREVKVGETWTRQLQDVVPQVGRIFFEYKCKLDRLAEENGRKVAIVTYTGTVKKDPDDKGPHGPSGTFNMTGDFAGDAVFDIELGEFVRIKQTNKSTLEQQVVGGSTVSEDDPPSLRINVVVETAAKFCSLEERAKEKDKSGAVVASALPTTAPSAPAAVAPVSRVPTSQPAN